MQFTRRTLAGHDVFISNGFLEAGTAVVYAPTLQLLLEIKGGLGTRLASHSGPLDGELGAVSAQLASVLGNAALKSSPVRRRLHRDATVFALSVGLTRDCSLRCVYCHAEAGEHQGRVSREVLAGTLDHALAAMAERNIEELHLSFAVGGEPTYDWQLFRQFLQTVNERARDESIRVVKSLTTNGYYSLDHCRQIASEFDHVLLSFDGFRHIQDLHRPTLSGGGSFETVYRSAKYFATEARSFSVRATISSASVNLMRDLVAFFVGALGTRTDIVFEPLVSIGRATRSVVVGPPDEMAFARNFWKAQTLGHELGVRTMYSGFGPHRLVASFCAAMTLPSFTVTTDGVVTACERDCTGSDYRYGVWDAQGFSLSESALEANAQLAQVPEACEECIAKWHCAGDCPDLRRMGYSRCRSTTWLLEKNLLRQLRAPKPE
ncbi:MAG: radical SAM protein [Candidatus Bipolaricaulis sp.]|nr:radical SAM protein [Candidatus Bipolaricaulis sp.]